jgi:hypothetical protein
MLRRTSIMPASLILVPALPLILGHIPRDRRYGIRTPKILSNAIRWYCAGRRVGWMLLLASMPYRGIVALMPHPPPPQLVSPPLVHRNNKRLFRQSRMPALLCCNRHILASHEVAMSTAVSRLSRRSLRFAPLSPIVLTLLVAGIVVSIVYTKLSMTGFDPLSFVRIDGWFVYWLAASFPSLNATMDLAPYRAQRILLSALAAPFGPAIPWALIGLNVLALVFGTYALARLARRYEMPAIMGTMFGLWIGSLFVVEKGLTEVLAYALVLWGILCWENQRPILAGLLCGLAVLAKETTLLYGIAFVLASNGWRWRQRICFAALAFGPGALWQLVLLLTFGDTGITAAAAPGAPAEHMLPLAGLLWADMAVPWAWGLQIGWALVPALAAVIWGAYLLWRQKAPPVALALILNGLFVISLPPPSTEYFAHSARLGLGVVVGLAWATIRTRRPLVALVALNIAFVPLLFFDVDRYF